MHSKPNGSTLFLMDMEMPVLNGLDATRRLRDWEKAEGRARNTDHCPDRPCFFRTSLAVPGCRVFRFYSKTGEKTDASGDFEQFCSGRKGQGEKRLKPVGTPEATPEFIIETDHALAETIAEYLRATRQDCYSLVQALKDKDLETIKAIGLDLKDSSAKYRLGRIEEIGENICSLAEEKALRGVLEQVKQLNHYVKNANVSIRPSGTNGSGAVGREGNESRKKYTVTVDDDLVDVIDEYLQAIRKDCLRMVDAYKNKDFDVVYGIAHDLKGSGAGYGLNDVTEIGRAICELVRKNDFNDVWRKIGRLQDYIDHVEVDGE